MTKPFDPLALRIGHAYQRGLAAHAEAGRLLAEKRATLKRGEWLPWIKANAIALRFNTDRTAQRLMKLAADYPTLASDSLGLGAAEEKAIERLLWGHNTKTKTKATPTRTPDADPSDSPQYLFSTVDLIALVKEVMDEIDIDTSSCQEANDKFAKALKFFSIEQDGLKYDWCGRIYLNPMYDTGNLKAFMEYLVVQIEKGNTTEAISITPNSSDKGWYQNAFKLASAFCLPLGRVKFHAPGTGKTGNPALPSVIMYFGPHPEKFVATFQKIGVAMKTAL